MESQHTLAYCLIMYHVILVLLYTCLVTNKILFKPITYLACLGSVISAQFWFDA